MEYIQNVIDMLYALLKTLWEMIAGGNDENADA